MGHAERRSPVARRAARALVAALLFACGCFAAADQRLPAMAPAPQLPKFPPFKRIATPAESGAIPLYQGVAPGSESAQQVEVWDTIMGDRVARNVTRPTLTPFLPDPAKATGAAVIVAPGGAFMMLSMDMEGTAVARALAERGIAAVLLKYRLDATPADEKTFEAAVGSRFAAAAKAGADKVAPIEQPLAIKDAVAALAYVRSHAAAWHIDAHRVGIVGFSAGAMTALQATLQHAAPRPDFAAIIYGPMTTVSAPAPLPPLFVAIAADDPLFGNSGFGLVESWKKAGAPVEMHLYDKGGHGFGMRHQGTSSDHWLEQFVQWLQSRGLLTATHKP